ncbi:MAG: 2-iminobutanoate/2-iminopropanoate deaminase [Actinomycetota bacterium]|jgi:2-iminobutanoate/2-iminopropanoate deaminase|nr:2-iminobutanoate/2-iminopropanoate deaminase [Actinomycetota bacterium]
MDRDIGRGRGLVVALVAGLVGFGAGGGALWGRAGAADSPPAPEFLNADPATTAPYSDVVRVGSMLYLAGHLGLDADGKLVPGGITPEAQRTMENLKHTLERNGSSLERVVSCLVFLADIRDREAFNAVYQHSFAQGHFPARSAFGTSGLYLGARVEISCTAVAR